MSLAALLEEAEKTASSNEPSEDQIKEAYAAGRIAGAAYRDEVQKIAQAAKRDEMGVAYKEEDDSDTEPEDSDGQTDGTANVDEGREEENEQHMTVRDTNNDQGAGTAVTNEKTEGPQPNKPETNQEKSVEGSVEELAEYLEELL